MRAYVAATGDPALLTDLFPRSPTSTAAGRTTGSASISDGLVRGGADGVQLTWMDAKVACRVVTPRRGKPVGVNALWYNALHACESFAARLGTPADAYAADAERAVGDGAVLDPRTRLVLRRPGRPRRRRRDAPPEPALHRRAVRESVRQRARSIVDACAARLRTSLGLRTLDPADPVYRCSITGSQAQRDEASHQGTVWPWLIGPFARAHLRAYGDRDRADVRAAADRRA